MNRNLFLTSFFLGAALITFFNIEFNSQKHNLENGLEKQLFWDENSAKVIKFLINFFLFLFSSYMGGEFPQIWRGFWGQTPPPQKKIPT